MVVKVKDIGPGLFEARLEGQPWLVGFGSTLTDALGTIEGLTGLLPPPERFEETGSGVRLRHFPDIRGFGTTQVSARGDVLLNHAERFCVTLVYNH